MVTTRSQEKHNAQTPVKVSTFEVAIPSATRSTPKTSTPLPTLRSTRSTPRSAPRGSFANPTTHFPGQSVESSSNGLSGHETNDVQSPKAEEALVFGADPARETPQHSSVSGLSLDTLEAHGSTMVSIATLPQRLKDPLLASTQERFPSESHDTPTLADDRHPDRDDPASMGSYNSRVPREIFAAAAAAAAADEDDNDNDDAPEQVSFDSHKSNFHLVQQGRRKRRRSHADLDEPPSTTAKVPIPSFNGSGVTSFPNSNSLKRSTDKQSATEEDGVTATAVPELNPAPHDGEVESAAAKETSNADHGGSIEQAEVAARTASGFVAGVASSTEASHPRFAAQATAHPLGMSMVRLEATDVEVGSQTEAGSEATLTGASYTTAPEEKTSAQHVQSAKRPVSTLMRVKSKTLLSHRSKQESQHGVRPEISKTTALQQFRNDMLKQRARTSHWAPGGARRTRFVGA